MLDSYCIYPGAGGTSLTERLAKDSTFVAKVMKHPKRYEQLIGTFTGMLQDGQFKGKGADVLDSLETIMKSAKLSRKGVSFDGGNTYIQGSEEGTEESNDKEFTTAVFPAVSDMPDEVVQNISLTKPAPLPAPLPTLEELRVEAVPEPKVLEEKATTTAPPPLTKQDQDSIRHH